MAQASKAATTKPNDFLASRSTRMRVLSDPRHCRLQAGVARVVPVPANPRLTGLFRPRVGTASLRRAKLTRRTLPLPAARQSDNAKTRPPELHRCDSRRFGPEQLRKVRVRGKIRPRAAPR